MSKGRFHITVVDTECDEVCVDSNADVVIGAYQDGGSTGHLCYAAAGSLDIATCYIGAVSVLKLLEKNNHAIGALSKFGILDSVVDSNLDEVNKGWKQMTVSFPDFKGGCR